MSETPIEGAATATKQIARAAGTVMAAFVFSNLVGLVRDILIYRAFGTSVELDSFNAANRVAEMLYYLMAGGALGSAFIPTFTGFITREDRQGAWKLASAVANLLVIFLSLVSLVAAYFAPQIVRHGLFILSPEMSAGQEELTVQLLRILLPTVTVFGISGLVMGILNAHQRFFIPAIAPAMYSLGMVFGVLVFPQSWGIDRLAWGALLGAVLHLCVQMPDLYRLKPSYRLTLGRGMSAVGEVFRLMGPRIFGVAVVQLNFVINIVIALSLPEGSVSAVNLAFRLMLMPQVAIAQSIAIASMPTFSAQVAQGQEREMRASLASTLRGLLLLAIPASIGLIMLRRPLVVAFYEGGAFTPRSTELVTWALLFYAAGLVGHSVVEIASRAFYALHDTRTPVLLTAAAMTLNIVFSLLFTRWFSALGWAPHGGLALANSLATFLEMTGLLIAMRRRLGGLHGRDLLQVVGQSGLAAMVMCVVLWGWLVVSLTTAPMIVLLVGLVLGVAAYGVMLVLLRVKEIGQIRQLASRFVPALRRRE